MHIKPAIMTSNEILKADMLDILFDNRNKLYGAYTLRKNYNQRLGMALGISLSMAALLFVIFPQNMSSGNEDGIDKGIVQLTHIELPSAQKLPPILPKQTLPVPKVKHVDFVNPVIKKDIEVNTILPTQLDISDAIISTENIAGLPSGDEVTVVNNPPPAPVKQDEPKHNTVAPIQREPEFPGGVDAWLKFLQRNLVAPEELEAGQTKTVSIRFYVSTEGVVTNFEVLKSAGTTFDEEVIRVLKKMPKWKPAIQNGLPVARAFTQPVTFMGVEQ